MRESKPLNVSCITEENVERLDTNLTGGKTTGTLTFPLPILKHRTCTAQSRDGWWRSTG